MEQWVTEIFATKKSAEASQFVSECSYNEFEETVDLVLTTQEDDGSIVDKLDITLDRTEFVKWLASLYKEVTNKS